MLLSRYMTLKKDDKTASKDKPKKQIVKSDKPTLKIKELVTSAKTEKEKVKPKEKNKTSCEKVQSQDDDEDDGSGPSSGTRLTYEERQKNLCEVYRLQRKMLRGLISSEHEDEEEEVEEEEENDEDDDREGENSNENEL